MHASVLLGNQHYHSMVCQILAYLSTALINTIWAGKKKVSSQALKVIFGDEDLKNWWASISKDIYFSILKALWGRNTPCKAFLIYRQAVIALQFLKVKSGKSEGHSQHLSWAPCWVGIHKYNHNPSYIKQPWALGFKLLRQHRKRCQSCLKKGKKSPDGI